MRNNNYSAEITTGNGNMFQDKSRENTSIDGIVITRITGRVNAPPPLDQGGMAVAAIATWVSVGDNKWFRWEGRNTMQIAEAISEAHRFNVSEWLEVLGEDLVPWC
jgi:hypothetical protein